MFVLAWSSGHNPPKPVYYYKSQNGWGGTYKRSEAKRFKTKKEALNTYLSVHAFPEKYLEYIEDGSVRAEPVNQLTLNF